MRKWQNGRLRVGLQQLMFNWSPHIDRLLDRVIQKSHFVCKFMNVCRDSPMGGKMHFQEDIFFHHFFRETNDFQRHFLSDLLP